MEKFLKRWHNNENIKIYFDWNDNKKIGQNLWNTNKTVLVRKFITWRAVLVKKKGHNQCAKIYFKEL